MFKQNLRAFEKQKDIPYIAGEMQNSTTTLENSWLMSTQKVKCVGLFTKNWSMGKQWFIHIMEYYLLVKRNEVLYIQHGESQQ